MSGNTIPVLWLENDKGEKYYPDLANWDGPPPGYEDYTHQVYRNPLELRTAYDFGNAGSTYPRQLVEAIVGPRWRNRLLQLWRTGRFQPRLALDAAIVRAAESCERCLNVDLHDYGCSDGYPLFSANWYRCNTTCDRCEHLPKPERRTASARTI